MHKSNQRELAFDIIFQSSESFSHCFGIQSYCFSHAVSVQLHWANKFIRLGLSCPSRAYSKCNYCDIATCETLTLCLPSRNDFNLNSSLNNKYLQIDCLRRRQRRCLRLDGCDNLHCHFTVFFAIPYTNCGKYGNATVSISVTAYPRYMFLASKLCTRRIELLVNSCYIILLPLVSVSLLL